MNKRAFLTLLSLICFVWGWAQDSFPGECTMYYKTGEAMCQEVIFRYEEGEARASVSGDYFEVGMSILPYYKYIGDNGNYLSFIGYSKDMSPDKCIQYRTVNNYGVMMQMPEYVKPIPERNGKSMSLSNDYNTLVYNGKTYNRISKKEYDEIQAAIQRGAAMVRQGAIPNNTNDSRSNSSSSSSGRSSNGSRTCPGCNGTGKGTDQITWAPNYTGNDNSRYCSVCGEVTAAHSHRTPMCRVCNGRGYVR